MLKKTWLLPLFLGIMALAIRFYALPSHAVFSADEEYQATYATTIVKHFHRIWIGVSAADTGFYLGPYFTYFTALWLFLGHGDPLVTNYAAAVIGALTVVLIYLLGKQMFSSRVGALVAVLYSVSPLMVYFDQRYWNPSPTPLLSCLLLLSLLNLRSQKWWLVVVAFCLGAFWHIHLSLVPLTVLALYIVWQVRRKIFVRVWLSSGMMLFLMFLPLMIFDYNHAWSNLLTPIRMLQSPAKHGLDLVGHTELLGDTLAHALYLVPGGSPGDEIRPGCSSGLFTTIPRVLSLLALVPLIFFLFRRDTWGSPPSKYLALAIIILSLAFIFYPGEMTGYYALGIFPLYFLVIGLFLSRLRWHFVILTLFILVSLRSLVLTSSQYGLAAKHTLINAVMSELGPASFSLQEEGTCHKYGGWRYLFFAYGRSPSTSSTDASLGWLYPHAIGSRGKYLVTVAATGESTLPPSPLAVITRGGYTAAITYDP
jgi:4-amino-4-deoxy-L-arabinose transferase-like glycosyltransferase